MACTVQTWRYAVRRFRCEYVHIYALIYIWQGGRGAERSWGVQLWQMNTAYEWRSKIRDRVSDIAKFLFLLKTLLSAYQS